MITLIRTWIMGLVGAAMLSGIALVLTPESAAKRVLELVAGTALILALIAPVTELDFSEFSMNLAFYRDNLAGYEQSITETNDRLSRTIIEEECAAYILDKAQVMGGAVSSARVTVKWGDEGCWYPYEIYIETSGEGTMPELSRIIEVDLGIPKERQYWNGKDENP